MKKIILIAGLFLGGLVFAQAPERMSYQAVVRNATGQLVQNQSVGIKASILQNSATGTVVYSERLTGTTNANGLVSLAIGSGTVLSGIFSSIDWSTGNYYLKTETDPTGGTNYAIAGTSQLLSVPYAMYAKTSGSGSTLTLPYAGISNTNNVIPFKITNSNGTLNQAGYFENTNSTNTAPALTGENKSVGGFGTGVEGRAQSNTNGFVSSAVRGSLLGTGTAGAGVYGSAENANGVYGNTTTGTGVYGYTFGTGTAGIFQAGSTGVALQSYGKLKLNNIGEGNGKILTSDATGNATWQNPANMSFPIITIQDSYTATDNDYTIRFVAANSTGINKTLTLPAAAGRTGRIYKIYAKIPLFGVSQSGSYSTLTISESGTGVNILFSELGVTVMMNRHNRFQANNLDEYIKLNSVMLQSDGTAWRVIDENHNYSRDYWEAPAP